MKISEILSALTSTGLSLVANGTPAATMFVAILPPLLKEAFDTIIPDIFHKGITKRELERLGISYKAAIDKINENVKNGIELRTDNLFVRSDNSYSEADDILEAILKDSMNDTEKKKAEFYGYFFGNLAFCPEINYSNAIILQKIISQLSYSHLCLIKYIHVKDSLNANAWKNKINQTENIRSMEIYHILKDIVGFDLTMQVPPITLGEEIGTIRLSCLGEAIYKLMDLNKVNGKEFEEISSIILKI